MTRNINGTSMSVWGLCYVVWYSTEVGELGPRDGSELLIEVTLNGCNDNSFLYKDIGNHLP
jgi:hypothetical protein